MARSEYLGLLVDALQWIFKPWDDLVNSALPPLRVSGAGDVGQFTIRLCPCGVHLRCFQKTRGGVHGVVSVVEPQSRKLGTIESYESLITRRVWQEGKAAKYDGKVRMSIILQMWQEGQAAKDGGSAGSLSHTIVRVGRA